MQHYPCTWKCVYLYWNRAGRESWWIQINVRTQQGRSYYACTSGVKEKNMFNHGEKADYPLLSTILVMEAAHVYCTLHDLWRIKYGRSHHYISWDFPTSTSPFLRRIKADMLQACIKSSYIGKTLFISREWWYHQMRPNFITHWYKSIHFRIFY